MKSKNLLSLIIASLLLASLLRAEEGGTGSDAIAENDYIIRMSAKDLPPTTAFWSVTFCNTNNGYLASTITIIHQRKSESNP